MNSSKFRRQVHILLALLVLASLPRISGCSYSYHVYQADDVSQGSPRPGQNQPATEWHEKTLHSFGWGLIRQDYPVTTCQHDDGETWGIEEVRIRSSFLHFLGKVVTLGLWSPVKVGYRCAKPCPPPTDL